MQSATPSLILASASRSRQALLAAAGLRFQVRSADVDEAALKQAARSAGASAAATALDLAQAKAAAIAKVAPDALVIGADQILVCGDVWYDKPPDLPTARTQLLALRGQSHGLATAVICLHRGKPVWQHVETPSLTMRRFSEAFLDAYLAQEGAHVLTSVGAYRLEGPGVHLFDRVEGEHSAILGLPLLPLLEFLRRAGVLIA